MAASSPLLRSLDRLAILAGHRQFLALWFVLCALPMGLGCALLTPVGMVSDELDHVARADGLLQGEILGRHPPPGFADYSVNAGVRIDNGIVAVLFSKAFTDPGTGKQLTAADRHEAASFPWFAGAAYYPTQMVEYFPLLYLPGAAGLALGKYTALPPYFSYFLGRVVMLLAYLALGALAIGLARFGNGLIFAQLTLPTMVDLAASYNQDGLILAACALAAALLTRARPALTMGWAAALLLLCAVLCAKPSYAALMLLCLAPLTASWRQRAQRLGWIMLACIPPGLWLRHLQHAAFIDYQVPPYHPGPLWPGPRTIWLHDMVPALNFQVLAAHPLELLRLPLVSLGRIEGENWLLLLGRISFNNSHIAAWEYPCLAAALGMALCGAALNQAGSWRRADTGLALAALFLAFIGMEISLYLTSTKAGMGRIDGVQTRYFAPFLPFLLFLLPGLGRLAGAQHLRVQDGWFYLPAMVMAVINVFALPGFIFHVYAMPGP